tara:strand:+ start:260 stop:985 length:726 start_codon:yes stop_codon:yes gene_type:complete
MEKNKIYNEDCLKTMLKIKSETIDLVIIDPPYFEVKGDFDFVWNNRNEYFDFIKKVLNESKRILKTNGSIFVYCSQEFGAEFDLYLRELFAIKNRLIWFRSGGVSPRKKYKVSHEPLFYCVNDINNHTWNLDDVRVKSKYADTDKRLNPKGKSPDDVWYFPNLVGKKKEKVNHPTQKPLSICDRIIKGSSSENDLCYIPFAGSGSELVSLKMNNRRYIGSEISKEYCNIIEKRLNECGGLF